MNDYKIVGNIQKHTNYFDTYIRNWEPLDLTARLPPVPVEQFRS